MSLNAHQDVSTAFVDNESGSESDRPRDTIQSTARKLPAWAKAAMKNDTRAQPWKKHVTTANDPLFAQGEELSLFYKAGMTLCAGEGSLAA